MSSLKCNSTLANLLTDYKQCDVCGSTKKPNEERPWSKLELGLSGKVEYQDICGHCTSYLVEILERLRNMNESDSIDDVWNDVKKKISEQK